MVRYQNIFRFFTILFSNLKMIIKFKDETQLMDIINGHKKIDKKYNYPHMS
jgi:hypothetical protein